MARIVITRPNGDVEYAELTEDKTLAGDDRLTVEKDGKTYYGCLAPELSTHMYVIKPDGRKLYVQKEIAFQWVYNLNGDPDKAKAMVIPRTGKYKITFERTESEIDPDNIIDTETVTKLEVFEQGGRFYETKRTFCIKTKKGSEYMLQEFYERGTPESEEYTCTQVTLLKIEYIGEA